MLDSNFKQYRIGIVYKADTETTAYVTNDYNITSGEITISNTSTLLNINLNEILINNTQLNRVNASTIIDNRLYLGNSETLEDIKYQKYACNINSEYVTDKHVALDTYEDSYKDEVVLFSDKGFMPFEVYAFYIRFIRSDTNTPSNSFHIPGRAIAAGFDGPSTNADELSIYPNAREWHMQDYSGAEASPTVGRMGLWENESETYPDDDEYDGTRDYNNFPIISPAGISLKGERVRHHRFPSLRDLKAGGVDPLEGDYPNNVNIDVTFSSPIEMVYPNKFNYTNSNNVGYFEDSRTYVNNTGGDLSGLVDFYFYIGTNQSHPGDLSLHIALLKPDNTLAPVPPNDYIYYEKVADTAVGSGGMGAILIYIVGQSLTIPNGYKLRIDYSKPYQDKFYFINTDSFLTFHITSSTTPLYSGAKVLGIKFSNIYIPQYIKDTCSHYEILYAERTSANLSVISTGFINKVNAFQNVGGNGKYYGRLYCFDLMVNKPSLNISYLRHELISDTSIHSISSVISFPKVNIYPVITSKYQLNNIGYYEPSNLYRDEHIGVELDASTLIALIGEHVSEVNPVDEGTDIVSIVNFNPNLYGLFTNQKLVRTGQLIEIGSTGAVISPNIYGGDVTVDLHGNSNYLVDVGVTNMVRNYLVPEYSFSNIGYRYTDNNPTNYMYPKYNIATGDEGIGVTEPYRNANVGDGSIFDKIKELNGNTFELEDLIEYYGYENILNSVLNIEPIIIYNTFNNFINTFPYRINRSIVQGSETLGDAWRVLLPNEYYDCVNNKGVISVLDTDGITLLVEHEYALYVLKGINELKFADGVVSALGDADIFDNKPSEVVTSDEGYVGCQSKFASFRCVFGNIIVDRQQGKIFLYDNYKVDEISRYGLFNWFDANLNYDLSSVVSSKYGFGDDTDLEFEDETIIELATRMELTMDYSIIDNPYNQLGITCAYDKDNERLIFVKNQDNIDANKSWTLSYYPRHKQWVSFHEYNPNVILNNRNGIYIANSAFTGYSIDGGVFKLVDNVYHGNYYDGSTYYDPIIDTCFAQPYNVEKKFASFNWNTRVISIADILLEDLTFNTAIVYNNHRHSSPIALSIQTFTKGNIRETNGSWKFNNFRDLLDVKTLKVVDALDIDELQFDTVAAPYTDWYNKGLFIDKYVIIRLIFTATAGIGIIINDIGSNANITGRI